MHEFLIEIFNDFCFKHDMPKNEDGSYLSASDVLHHRDGYVPLTEYQVRWLENYINLWDGTNGGEDI